MENLIFKLKSDLGVGSVALYDLIFLLSKIREIKFDKHIKHLLLQTKLSNSKVEQVNLNLGFRAVVRIWKSSCQEEFKVVIV